MASNMKTLHVNIQPIGNSHGVVIPKPLLAQAGLGSGAAEMSVEGGALILRRLAKPARLGWAEAAAKIAAEGNDHLVMGAFGNDAGKELAW